MRKLNTADVFKAMRAVKVLGIKDELKRVSMEFDNIADIGANGFDILFSIMESVADEKGEKLIYDILSGPFERTPQEIGAMDILALVDELQQIADVDGWKSFLSHASR